MNIFSLFHFYDSNLVQCFLNGKLKLIDKSLKEEFFTREKPDEIT